MQPLTRVLYLLHDSRRSGVPAVAAHAVKALNSTVVEPCMLFAYDGVYSDELRACGIKTATVGKRRPFLWRLNRFLLNFHLLRYRGVVDAVHIHSIKLAWSVLAAKVLGFRVVYHLHEMPKRIGWLLAKALAAADCTVFCSQTCAAHFTKVPVRSRRTIVNALRFDDKPPVHHHAANRRIVMVGSINNNKGQDVLLKAFAQLKDPKAELWLYGSTGLSAHKYVHDLKRLAVELEVSGRVFFNGPVADIFSVFAEAAVVVHTSWTESFGMALVEAQSCGIPVIAHDLEGMQEVVADGESGFLVEPGNTKELAERLDALLKNPELRSRMGTCGYRMVRERFSIGKRLSDYQTLYQEVCGK